MDMKLSIINGSQGEEQERSKMDDQQESMENTRQIATCNLCGAQTDEGELEDGDWKPYAYVSQDDKEVEIGPICGNHNLSYTIDKNGEYDIMLYYGA